MTPEIGAKITTSVTMTAALEARYSFTAQFFKGAAAMTRAAAELEARGAVSPDEQIVHRAYVVSAVMQAVAGLEAELWEVTWHGPGHQLGSGGIDVEARDYLRPLADVIDNRPTVDRYAMVLHLLRREPMEPGHQPWQDTALVVRLRNHIAHYKSHWESEVEEAKLLEGLERKRFRPPPFVSSSSTFFPHRCLSADCAGWATRACARFLEKFYSRLGVVSPLEPHKESLNC